MYTPQAGIFALGTSSHAYLEFDLLDPKQSQEFVSSHRLHPRAPHHHRRRQLRHRLSPRALALARPRTTHRTNRHRLQQRISGIEDFVMPATQHDALIWLSGCAYDVLFDMARTVIHDLAASPPSSKRPPAGPTATIATSPASSTAPRTPRSSTRPATRCSPKAFPAPPAPSSSCKSGSTTSTEWEAVPVAQQEHIMGRTKPDSIELENKPADSHVARTDQDVFGKIFRRNMPYGNVENHGTVFVGFSAAQQPLARMLDSMAGLVNGTRDALTRYTQPLPAPTTSSPPSRVSACSGPTIPPPPLLYNQLHRTNSSCDRRSSARITAPVVISRANRTVLYT